MALSASRQRRWEVTRRIVVEAQGLCLEHGFNGFTLDQLVEAAGVSRRTLFNHVGDKEHAVFGPSPELDEELLAQFRAGGASGDLLRDALWFLERSMVHDEDAEADITRLARLVETHPDLLPRVVRRLEDIAEELVQHVLARPGETSERAELALGVLFAVVRAAWRTTCRDHVPFSASLARAARTLLQLTQLSQHP